MIQRGGLKSLQPKFAICSRKIVFQRFPAPCIKANAYGHDMIKTAKIALASGADWLNVNALFEAAELRKAGIRAPIYIMGYVMKKDLIEAVRLNCRLVVYNKETVEEAAQAAKRLSKKAFVHLKIETGNNRQGILMENVLDFAAYAKKFPQITIEGISTHFANIEDISVGEAKRFLKNANREKPFRLTAYPAFQLKNFRAAISLLKTAGINIPLRHCANSAATLLFPETYFDMVRPGISVYGLWPSQEVKIAFQKTQKKATLLPVLSWRTKIAQIKNVSAGTYIGYGCTYCAKRNMKIAILPVGYYDGFDRRFSNRGYVLIRGKRATLCGRVCMNIIMADVTDIPSARVEDTATLLGKDGREEITADELAEIAGTINYEITTRINEKIPRIVV
ncbi:alanine racemase [Candidatus Peregrinibacteria bacterium]|nr:alanine racemase [Candidatus Peregrinibacteria bacterium]